MFTVINLPYVIISKSPTTTKIIKMLDCLTFPKLSLGVLTYIFFINMQDVTDGTLHGQKLLRTNEQMSLLHRCHTESKSFEND